MDGKLSRKGAWSGHVNHLNFGGTNRISGMSDARVVIFCMHVVYVKSQDKDDKSPLEGAWSGSCDPVNL